MDEMANVTFTFVVRSPTNAEVVEALRLLAGRRDELVGLIKSVNETEALIVREFPAHTNGIRSQSEAVH